tara:strand:+ start:2368 stop:2655 length:288 start_codon:yes stop_codon:yes gene_type:complete
MFYEYKKFILNKIVNEKNDETLLIILAVFLFLVFFSILYNIYNYYFYKKFYKKKLLNIEMQYILLRGHLNNRKIDVNTYKKKVNILNNKVREIIK